jgi:hypothetical protein
VVRSRAAGLVDCGRQCPVKRRTLDSYFFYFLSVRLFETRQGQDEARLTVHCVKLSVISFGLRAHEKPEVLSRARSQRTRGWSPGAKENSEARNPLEGVCTSNIPHHLNGFRTRRPATVCHRRVACRIGGGRAFRAVSGSFHLKCSLHLLHNPLR